MSGTTSSLLIDNQAQFDELCEHIRAVGIVAYDTEFVSEHTYLPELCLLQLATPERAVAVDPYRVPDLSAWWKILADETTTVIVHAGREEIRFCLHLGGCKPQRVFDTQLAEGLRSTTYPVGYESLVTRVLGERLGHHATRTDWRRRPLSPEQLAYAVDDVRYLIEVWKKQQGSLKRLKRLEWAETEFTRLIDELEHERNEESWRRFGGLQKMKPRQLVVARELFQWRERVATERNQPLRRILRDDLIVDLAMRQPKTAEAVLATRDMNRPGYKKHAAELADCISRGIALPETQWPKPALMPDSNSEDHILSKLLQIVLANRCAEMKVALGLVGTSADLKNLVRWHSKKNSKQPPPRLAQGWRAEVCGDLLADVLDGKVRFRVGDRDSEHPLVFESLAELSKSAE
ncbi:MAG: HRDC domain-containing protein [Planctomycetaceae bacterium]|nr:HRDC domain-containing protein [Planctomycetaceae bacterium]